MTDVELFEKLCEQFQGTLSVNNNLSYSILGLLIVNIVMSALKLFSEFKLKSYETTIHKSNIRESKRIDICEKIFLDLTELSYIDPHESNSIISSVTTIERSCAKNGLYLNASVEKNIFSICDYFKSIATDFRKKDLKMEKQLFDKFKTSFNK
jgi:hypothetical protein